jgi:NAD dependent epimerase/dehydratase family enzyme
MRFVLAGASGFLGTAWRDHLAHQGHLVTRLVRRPAVSADESQWDPAGGVVDQQLIENADVAANLAGAPIEHWPWTAAYK